ncbi:lytic transglycosylase domain-containing protein [Psychrobacter sp. K31L]|uniref:lytic transglycosylase domain-containing protein n=1 Tax=Psychrobacter sp. K31L TaxID=2820758 RepID=UPI001B326B4A|nr:lytic transglycosylase domain-containing protein [Psychrobacter sp. K31L]MBP3947272.1 lytic transglycosylase domain-containing protein [Psychrobacter sp. K31L]
MLESNKNVINLSLLSAFLTLSYPAHTNVKYIDMNNFNPQSAEQNTIQIIEPSTVQPNNLVTRSQTKLDTIIDHNARKYDIPSELLRAIIRQESNFNNTALSSKGAIGLMQVMPSTAADYGYYNLYAPHHNVEVGSRHLASLLKRYKLPIALAAYNAGEGNINKYGGIPPFRETQSYVLNVLKYYNVELDKRINNTGIMSNAINLTPIDNNPLIVSKSEKLINRNSVLYLSINR